MAQLFANNAYSTLNGGISAGATSIVVQSGHGARFPSPSAPDFFLATLTQGAGNEASWEVVKVTARSTDTFTVVRAMEGTTGAVWASADKFELRLTKSGIENMMRPYLITTQQTNVSVDTTIFTQPYVSGESWVFHGMMATAVNTGTGGWAIGLRNLPTTATGRITAQNNVTSLGSQSDSTQTTLPGIVATAGDTTLAGDGFTYFNGHLTGGTADGNVEVYYHPSASSTHNILVGSWVVFHRVAA